jgi:predicted nucleotidyltransferase
MLLDFSTEPDLRALARLTRSLEQAARPLGVEYFLMGAAARDLMLRYAHGIATVRATEDADFAVMVRDWSAYDTLRARLIGGGEFTSSKGPAIHRLRHTGGLPLDIVPFGGVERGDRTVAWPGEPGVVFDCFGVKEAFNACVTVRLPDDTDVKVAPIPALTILKVCAWRDRKHTHPGRDAFDLLLFLRNYMDCGNLDRASTEHADLLEGEDFDYIDAGVRLLARDMVVIADRRGTKRILDILLPEADEAGGLLLAHQSGIELEVARGSLEVLCRELSAAVGTI